MATAEDCPSRAEEYSDPARVMTLPFLFPGEIPSERFKLEEDGTFSFYGRKIFRNVYEHVMAMDFRGNRLYHIHGTLGVGKSFLLAALACCLTRNGKAVLFLPDCRSMLRNPFRYIQKALCLTFVKSPGQLNLLQNCKSVDDLIEFCLPITDRERLYVIIDQLNALDPQEPHCDRNDDTKKTRLRNQLDLLSSEHLSITSSSGNYSHGLYDRLRNTGIQRLDIHTGLDQVRYSFYRPIHCSISDSLHDRRR